MNKDNELAFIFGLESRITGSAFLSAQTIYDLVGENGGDLIYHHAINRQIGPLQSLPLHVESEEVSAAGSIGVIPAANQISAHADRGGLAKRFGTLDINLVAIRLGAQCYDVDNIPKVPNGAISWFCDWDAERRTCERT